ncbi:MAG: ABC transporter ATP-binding protein [Candidatus Sumerlaeaceae bacterium]
MEEHLEAPAPSSKPVVHAVALTKHYGPRPALTALDLELHSGEILGLLGPNGAGKTTALRAILGFIRPSKGHVTLFGIAPRSWRACFIRRRIGYLPGDLAFDEAQTGARLLELLGKLSRVPVNRRNELCERFQLSAADLRLTIRKYSRGMKQKLGLIAALQHDPELVILDEPTTALDPVAQQVLYEILRERATSRTAILFSTHVLSEALQLCDRIAVLSEGKLLNCFRVAEFTDTAHRLLYIKMDHAAHSQPARAPRLPFADLLREENGWLVYRIEPDVVPDVLHELTHLPIADVRIESAALEHLLDYYRLPKDGA